MWDVKGSLIQVEIGEELVQRYSSKGFLGFSNSDGKLLLDEFSVMRKKLQDENIFVPYIQCRDDNSLGRQEFIVYVGAEFFRSNIRENEITDVIEFLIRRYQMEPASKENVHKYITMANEYIAQWKYTDGLRYLSTAYFWANLLVGCEEEAADIILQIGRILIQNNDMYHAQLCARRAEFITSLENFYNPYLKCASDEFSGFLHMLEEDFQAADQAYVSAFKRIANVPEANLLKIGVLAANLQVLQLCGDFVKANQVAQLLIDVLAQSSCPNLMPMYQLKSYIANCAIKQLKAENTRLKEDVRMLTEKYNDVLEKLRFDEQLNGMFLALLKWGILNLPALVGSLTVVPTGGKPCTRMNNINIGTSNQILLQMTDQN